MTQSTSTLSDTQNISSLNFLLKGSTIVLGIRTAGIVLTFLAQVFLVHWMGKTEYGMYEYIISLSLVLAIPVNLGLPRAVIRFMSEYRVRQEWSELRGLIWGSWQVTASLGLMLTLIGVQVINFLDQKYGLNSASIFLVGIWFVPLQALICLQEDMSRGINNMLLAYGPSRFLWPLLVILGGAILFHQNHELTIIPMLKLALFMMLILVLFQMVCLGRKFNQELDHVKPTYKPKEWLMVALPMILGRTAGVLLSQTDIIMLGSLAGPDATGIYSATIRTAMWVSFILHSLNHAVTPSYAVLYAQKDNLNLQKVASSITLWAFVPAIITASSLAIFAQPVLNIFGSDFMVADWTLRVLIIGCLVDVSCGSCSNILVMAGYQNAYSITSILLVLMNIVLNAILIPQFGIMGAAIATSLSLIVGNVGTCVFLAQKTNINSSILSLLNFSKTVE